MTTATTILLAETGAWALLAAAAAITTWVTHPPGRNPGDDDPSSVAWNSSVFAAGFAVLLVANNVYLLHQAPGLLAYSYAVWFLIGQAIVGTAVTHSYLRALATYRREIHSRNHTRHAHEWRDGQPVPSGTEGVDTEKFDELVVPHRSCCTDCTSDADLVR